MSAGSTTAAGPATPKGPPPAAAAAPKLAPRISRAGWRLLPTATRRCRTEVSQLGPLDVQAVAELAATSPEEAGQAADGLRHVNGAVVYDLGEPGER